MLFNFHINNTKISSHGLIRKHKQFILNHLQNTFSHQENHVTIHMNSKTLGLLFTATKFEIFSIRFKGFEIKFMAKSSLRISLTINMVKRKRELAKLLFIYVKEGFIQKVVLGYTLVSPIIKQSPINITTI